MRMITGRSLGGLLLLLTVLIGLDAVEHPLLQRHREAMAAAARLRSTFTLVRHLQLFDEPLTSTGVLEIDRVSRSVRWEFTGELVLILADGRLRRWDADGVEEAVSANDPGVAMLQRQMMALLDGDWNGLAERFTLTPSPDDPNRIGLVPADADLARVMARIDLVFAPDSGALVELCLIAPAGDRSVYAFAPPVIDGEIPASRFAGP